MREEVACELCPMNKSCTDHKLLTEYPQSVCNQQLKRADKLIEKILKDATPLRQQEDK